MGKVIALPAKPIPPKSETHAHAGQNFTITYDPVAREYVWAVNYVRVYKFFNGCPTYQKAYNAARRKIHELNRDTQYWEEASE